MLAGSIAPSSTVSRALLVNFLAALLVAIPLRAASQAVAPGPPDARPAESSDASEGASQPQPAEEEGAALPTLAPVLVTAPRLTESPPGTAHLGGDDLASQRASTSDTARLLKDVAGVSLYGAGGISSLPAIHGLADDRVRVQVDGMDLTSACPNHMNSALSYIEPTKVGSATVFAGITPVSVGGDSIGGTIHVESAPPVFAEAPGEILARGRAGAFFRSNGKAHGYDASALVAAENLQLSYAESSAQSDNYTAAKAFKPAANGSLIPGGEWLDGNEVGSSAFEDVTNRNVGVAMRRGDHLLELNGGLQEVGFEGFPNQRMDMTDNTNLQLSVHYAGHYSWGEMEARIYGQNTRHTMDMGPDRFFYGFGMPMNAKADTRGAMVSGDLALSERDVFRVGSEHQSYDLNDWWSPVGTNGTMAPDSFWNIRDGERDRTGLFGEWQAQWNPAWVSLLGVRGDMVTSNAGNVQGYNDNMRMWTTDANAFNQLDRRRRNYLLDVVALARYMPHATLTLEAGYARKSRSPSLYERYPWSTNVMAALMNNTVGDGNGYVGNVDLEPEVAHTFSGTVVWHDAENDEWELKATGYLTNVHDFIDARRCDLGQCSQANATSTTSFVTLQYVNQSARLYGVDLSGHLLLGRRDGFGSFTATGSLSYVRGENRTTDDDLYHIMPLNGTLGLVHRLGSWTTTAELQVVASKRRVSHVRNEVPTGSYSLFNLRSSYEWKHARLDVSIENVFNRFYEMPLGGAYLGQGASMSTNTIAWGVTVPGMGRSVSVALTLNF